MAFLKKCRGSVLDAMADLTTHTNNSRGADDTTGAVLLSMASDGNVLLRVVEQINIKLRHV